MRDWQSKIWRIIHYPTIAIRAIVGRVMKIRENVGIHILKVDETEPIKTTPNFSKLLRTIIIMINSGHFSL